MLASASGDSTVRVWNLDDGSCVNKFSGHFGSVLKISWICLGLELISGNYTLTYCIIININSWRRWVTKNMEFEIANLHQYIWKTYWKNLGFGQFRYYWQQRKAINCIRRQWFTSLFMVRCYIWRGRKNIKRKGWVSKRFTKF